MEENTMKPPFLHRKPLAMMILMGLVMLSLAAWLGLQARNAAREYDFIGVPVERNTITVTGEGKVTVMPDIANIQLGTVIEKPTVSAAQQANTDIMNALDAKLAAYGVDKKDIQTSNYSIQPVYDWNNGQQSLRGYQVSQSLQVKIRKLDSIGDILGDAGQLGVNQVGGIDFTVDDSDAVKQQARVKALADAKDKAQQLANVVGISLRRVVSFGENVTVPIYSMPFAANKAVSGGSAAPAPTIETGSAEFVVDVNLTYEIE